MSGSGSSGLMSAGEAARAHLGDVLADRGQDGFLVMAGAAGREVRDEQRQLISPAVALVHADPGVRWASSCSRSYASSS